MLKSLEKYDLSKGFVTIVTGDTNDGDYTTRVEKFPIDRLDDTNLKAIQQLLEVRKKHGEFCFKWGISDCKEKSNDPSILYKDLLNEDDIEIIESLLLPFGSSGGCYGIHTINRIVIVPIEYWHEL